MKPKVTAVVGFKKAPLNRASVIAGCGEYMLGDSFGGKSKQLLFRAAPGRVPTLIGETPELGFWHSIASHESVLFVAGNFGVFRSTNGGKAWSPARVTKDSWGARGVAVDGNGTLWVGFDDKMSFSTDGKNWTHVGKKGGPPVVLDGTVYFCGGGVVGMWNGKAFDTVKVGKNPSSITRNASGVFLVLDEVKGHSATGDAGTLPKTWQPRKVEGSACCAHGETIVIASQYEALSTVDGAKFEVIAKLPCLIQSVIPADGGVWICGAHGVERAGALSFVGTLGAAKPSTAAAPAAAPEVAAPARRPRGSRPKPTTSKPRELVVADAFREYALAKWLEAPPDAFTAKQRVLVYDGDVVADRFETPASGPHSVIVRGNVDVDALEWAADDTTCFLLVEGTVCARYAWLYGNQRVRIAKGMDVEEVVLASGDGYLEVCAGGLRAQAVLQQHEHTITVKGKLEALVVGDPDQVDRVAYEEVDGVLVSAALDDGELDPQRVRKLLRAEKPVLRDTVPARN